VLCRFDTQAAYELYQKILMPLQEPLRAKKRLSFVLDGALTSLPPQLLVTRDPTGKALMDVAWLVRSHSVTVLPRRKSQGAARQVGHRNSEPVLKGTRADTVVLSHRDGVDRGRHRRREGDRHRLHGHDALHSYSHPAKSPARFRHDRLRGRRPAFQNAWANRPGA
jgi:CHAT domain